MADPKNITDPNLFKLVPSVADAEENARKLYSDTMRAQIDALKERRGDAAENDILNWQPMVDGEASPAKVSDTALRNAVDANPFQHIPKEALAKLIAETRAEIARCGPGSEGAVDAIRRAIENGVPHDAFLDEPTSETPNGAHTEPEPNPEAGAPLAEEPDPEPPPAEAPKRASSANTIVAAALSNAREAVRKEAVVDATPLPRRTSTNTSEEVSPPAKSHRHAILWAASIVGVVAIAVIAWRVIGGAPTADTTAKKPPTIASANATSTAPAPTQASTSAGPTARVSVALPTAPADKSATPTVTTSAPQPPAASGHPAPLSAPTGGPRNPGSAFKGED